MLVNYNASVNVNAQSAIDGQAVVYFGAIIKEDKTFNITKNINDATLYFENEDACEADYADFEAKVRELATK